MKRFFFTILIFATLSIVLRADEVNLSADASLKDVINEIITLYQKNVPQTKFVPNYAASGTLQTQINSGTPADVFISSSQDKMDLLAEKKLIVKDTRKDLVGNEVVLIVPTSKESEFHCFGCLGTDKLKKGKLVISDPNVDPAGQYAIEVFGQQKIKEKVLPKAVFGKSVSEVLTYVAQGEADAGVVYLTDAKTIPDKVKVLAKSPKNSHTPVVYTVAVVSTGNNPNGGKQFLDYLFTKDVQDIFVKYGYKLLK
jgi:molybdate transport system substrate-binding protein